MHATTKKTNFPENKAFESNFNFSNDTDVVTWEKIHLINSFCFEKLVELEMISSIFNLEQLVHSKLKNVLPSQDKNSV